MKLFKIIVFGDKNSFVLTVIVVAFLFEISCWYEEFEKGSVISFIV
jgi:hypothetical protein